MTWNDEVASELREMADKIEQGTALADEPKPECIAEMVAKADDYSVAAEAIRNMPPDSLADFRALCEKAGVPCPAATVTLTDALDGSKFSVRSISTILPPLSQGFARINGVAADGGLLCEQPVAETPEEVRDLCDREGVSYPTYEPEIVVDHILGPLTCASIEAIYAKVHSDGRILLFVRRNGKALGTATTIPIADLQRRAAEAGMDLPPVMVETHYGDENEWKSISAIKCYYGDSDKLLYSVRDGDGMWCAMTETPAQVMALCELAGWVKPKCVCVFTTPSGKPLELKPKDIRDVSWRRCQESAYLELRKKNPLERYIRESVGQVEQMLAAFEPDVG